MEGYKFLVVVDLYEVIVKKQRALNKASQVELRSGEGNEWAFPTTELKDISLLNTEEVDAAIDRCKRRT